MSAMRIILIVTLAALTVMAVGYATVMAIEYERPVQAAPPDNEIGEGYQSPPVQRPLPRPLWWNLVDVAAMIATMGLTAIAVLKLRSRNLLVPLVIASLLYFGFFRKGCVCPIGAIQNVTVALVDSSYVISFITIAVFFVPLLVAFAFGRVFCGAACPLGAIQDMVAIWPLRVPRLLDRLLSKFKYVYLLLGLWYAAKPIEQRDFVICRFDPFVGFFRMVGPGDILILGTVVLLAGMFIGRLYCRYLCPYGALLSLCSRFSWKKISITPGKELDCGLCVDACPFGAIENMRIRQSSCLFCARCFKHCPEQSSNWPDEKKMTATKPT